MKTKARGLKKGLCLLIVMGSESNNLVIIGQWNGATAESNSLVMLLCYQKTIVLEAKKQNNIKSAVESYVSSC